MVKHNILIFNDLSLSLNLLFSGRINKRINKKYIIILGIYQIFYIPPFSIQRLTFCLYYEKMNT